MKITDETWTVALRCAHSQYEGHVRQGRVATEEQRMQALSDALQHAVGIIQMRGLRPDAECGCDHQRPYEGRSGGGITC